MEKDSLAIFVVPSVALPSGGTTLTSALRSEFFDVQPSWVVPPVLDVAGKVVYAFVDLAFAPCRQRVHCIGESVGPRKTRVRGRMEPFGVEFGGNICHDQLGELRGKELSVYLLENQGVRQFWIDN
jgi:hypothetical protein